MNDGRTDASTSTEDVKDRPLCLFYFTHPFGVLSPEPPTVTGVAAAGPQVARAFLNMKPVPYFRSPTSQSDDYNTTPSSHLSRSVRLVRNYALHPGGGSLSSSLLSGDSLLGCGGSDRRVVPYNATLPPLRLPTPRELAWDGLDDVWPARCSTRERFSLPPIELPCSVSEVNAMNSTSDVDAARVVSRCGSELSTRIACRRRALFGRHRRARLSGVQRMVTCLMKRTVKVEYQNHHMGYIFDNCPTVHDCCFSVPLRPAVCSIAAAGLVWGCLYCFLFSGTGAESMEHAGMPVEAGKGMRYVHGALGVLLLAVNATLMAAAAYESDSLCEVYLWFTVLFWAALLVSTLAVATYAAVDGSFAFAGVYVVVMLCALLLTAYFSVVVGNYRMTLP